MPDHIPPEPDPQTRDLHREAASAYPQANDTRVLTPLLLMALIIATGVLLFSITGQVPTAHG